MDQKRDYYEVLGVAKECVGRRDKEGLPQACYQISPRQKPPATKEAEEKFKEAAEAYDVLSNDEKRQRYDQFGHNMGPQGFPRRRWRWFLSEHDVDGGYIRAFRRHIRRTFLAEPAVSAELRADGVHAQRRQRRGSDLRIRVKLKLRRNCQRCHKDSAYPDLCGFCSYCKGTGCQGWRGFLQPVSDATAQA